MNLCRRMYRPQLIVAIITMIFQQFDGINAVIVSLCSTQSSIDYCLHLVVSYANRGKYAC